LDECKTNDLGEPMHEACLIERLSVAVRKLKVALSDDKINRASRELVEGRV
jgi:hypothetical protein